jgi:hypothetical protein
MAKTLALNLRRSPDTSERPMLTVSASACLVMPAGGLGWGESSKIAFHLYMSERAKTFQPLQNFFISAHKKFA